jgi:hypothetical protein
MALIEKYFVVPALCPVASGATIKEGNVVALNTSGEVVLQGAGLTAYGIAGDTKSTSASSMEGIYSGWTNRVSDYFDDTKASGKVTVYHGGGEFATDIFTAGVAAANPGTLLYCTNGVLDTDDTQHEIPVALLTKANGDYISGVPGVDVNGDMALNAATSDGYIEFKLLI